MKDILPQDIKTEICNFVQNKINEKLNSHNENQYVSLVDKTIIRSLEKEIEFLKKKLFLKMKSFKKKEKTSTKMHETLKTSPTHSLAEHVSQKIVQSI